MAGIARHEPAEASTTNGVNSFQRRNKIRLHVEPCRPAEVAGVLIEKDKSLYLRESPLRRKER